MTNLPPPNPAHALPRERLHVLEIIGNAIVGGMERWVERFVERLPRERFKLSALCPFESPYADRLRALGAEVLVTPMEELHWASVQMAASLVQAQGVDVLHAHLPNAHLLAGLAGRLTGRPVLATIHGRQIGMTDLEVHRAVGSHISVVCQQSYFHALGLGVDAAHLSCEPNGVDTQAFSPRPRRAGAGLRAELGLADDTPLLGFVGRLSPEKGPEVFVRAVHMLRHLQPGAHAVMVGEGPLEANVRKLRRDHGLEERLHLLGLRDDMPALHNELDVLVSSSHTEGMPLAVMEAMACGVPVVATRVGGLPDMVEHGRSGWLVRGDDFQDIASRCNGLLADAGLRRRMGELARARVLARMDLDVSIGQTAALLQRLARPAGGAGMAPSRVRSLADAAAAHEALASRPPPARPARATG